MSDSSPHVPFVSVVVPVRDGAPRIAAALHAVLDGDWPPERMEVLVADGRSRDGTRDLVRAAAAADPHRRVRLLDNPRRITPAGLNVAWRAARGEVVVRLDAHALPAPDYLRRCVEALRASDAWAVGGPMVGRGEGAFGRAVARATALPLGTGGAAFRRAEGAGARFVDTVYLGAWPRAVLERLGGFDEGLPRNQDYELCLRIRASGGRVWLDPAIRSTTLTRGTPGALARQYHGYGRGRAATWRRHPASLRARQLLPATFVGSLALLATAATHFAAARRMLAVVVALYAAVLALAARRATRQDRSVAEGRGEPDLERGPRADSSSAVGASSPRGVPSPVAGWRLALAWLVMHLSWGAGFWRGLLLDALADRRRRRARPDLRSDLGHDRPPPPGASGT